MEKLPAVQLRGAKVPAVHKPIHPLALGGCIGLGGDMLLKALEWTEHADFINEKAPWIRRGAVKLFQQYGYPPDWLFWVVLVGGLLAIWLDASRPAFLMRLMRGAADPISPLEIVFDAANPAGRFWKQVQARDKDGNPSPPTLWEYRVEVRNKSDKTVRNVRVSLESMGIKPIDPVDMTFQKGGVETWDIAPLCAELVPVIWVWPPQAGDAWGPSAAEIHGPIRLIARGDDVPPAERVFEYRPDLTPALIAQDRLNVALTSTEMQFLRGRGWYSFWASPPFSSYRAKRRLEFIDSWAAYFNARRAAGPISLTVGSDQQALMTDLAMEYTLGEAPRPIKFFAYTPDQLRKNIESRLPNAISKQK